MSDTDPRIHRRLQMPNGEHVDVVYRDGRHAPGAAERPDRQPQAPGAPVQAEGIYAIDPANAAGLDRPADSARRPDPNCTPQELHVCFNCAGTLVYPLDWAEEGVSQWRILLRCPECEARREGVFEQTIVERLDDELDRASGALLSDLRRLTHANMAEEIEFFIRALDADLIVPSDF
jgi:hypothetical protein